MSCKTCEEHRRRMKAKARRIASVAKAKITRTKKPHLKAVV